MVKKYELIIHKFPEDIDAKLFLALGKMSGFDTSMNPNEGQMYSEFLLKDVQRIAPNNHAFHHYWIHVMEHCCPERALASADILTSLAHGIKPLKSMTICSKDSLKVRMSLMLWRLYI